VLINESRTLRMKKAKLNRLFALLFGLTLLLICSPARGQQGEPSTVEVGAQFTSLTLTPPAVKREVGVGARVTYNLNRNFALEAEGNYLPSGSTWGFTPGGSIRQGQFGVKAGKRWNRFGIFFKARPGFVSFDGTFVPRIKGFVTSFNGLSFPIYDFDHIVKTTHFSMDLGGVIEAYPSRRVIVRFDAGDTIIHFGPHDELDFSRTPEFFRAPGFTTHNFQLSTGVSFRLLMPKDESGASGNQTKAAKHDSTPRFEVGGHFTSLTFNPPRQVFSSGFPAFTDEDRPQTELGLGGRFTFNLINFLAVEAVLNYFPTADRVADGATGRILQGQFGVKAGKRFKRFGFFGKARPGFVTFTRSVNLVGTRPFTFSGRTFLMGVFETGQRTFFANDLGGVIEFYPKRRWSLRIDAGDTIIHYGPRSVSTFSVSPAFITSAPEKRHNFQITSGFAFRF
jgi:hypothetical protein